jgi:hypothetical protein
MLDAPTSVAKLALLAMNDIPTGSFIGRSLARREDRCRSLTAHDNFRRRLGNTFPNGSYRFAAVPFVWSWQKADITIALTHVRFRG